MYGFALRELNKRLVALHYSAEQRAEILAAVVLELCPERQRAALLRLVDEIQSQEELF